MKFVEHPEEIEDTVQEKGYDLHDKEVSAHIATCAAKEVFIPRHGTVQYFIKRSKQGLLDPTGLYFNIQDLQRKEQGLGRMLYEFAPVTQNCFNQYRRFLRTKNKLFLSFASNELINPVNSYKKVAENAQEKSDS